MDRKDFLKKSCQAGICTCAGLMLFSGNNLLASTTNEEPKEDWRIGFVQKRFTRLFEIIGKSTDKATRDRLIEQLGMFCARENEAQLAEYVGQIDNYLEFVQKQWVEKVEFDKIKNEIRVTGKKQESCFCPLVDSKVISKDFCNCSKGWQKFTYETILGKPVEVEILSSIIRGSDCCSFKISIV